MAFLKKSPWLLHYDGSSCNGCDIEVLACLTPVYDVERFGVINTGNPKHADILLISGSVNEQNITVIKQIYEQMPEPKVVLAIGICATSGGIFKDCYNIIGGIDNIIPVDVYVPGCAARPEAIIDGVIRGCSILEEKKENMPKAQNQAKVKEIEEKVVEDEAPIEVKYYGDTEGTEDIDAEIVESSENDAVPKFEDTAQREEEIAEAKKIIEKEES